MEQFHQPIKQDIFCVRYIYQIYLISLWHKTKSTWGENKQWIESQSQTIDSWSIDPELICTTFTDLICMYCLSCLVESAQFHLIWFNCCMPWSPDVLELCRFARQFASNSWEETCCWWNHSIRRRSRIATFKFVRSLNYAITVSTWFV